MSTDTSSTYSHSWENLWRNYKEKRMRWSVSLAVIAGVSLAAGLWAQSLAEAWDGHEGHGWVAMMTWAAGVACNLFCGAAVALVGLMIYYTKPGERPEEEQHSFEGRVQTSLKDIHATLQGIKNLDIRMLDLGTDIAVFSGFEGIMVAYNAPLIWERKFPERALFTHIMRYKDTKFRGAEYCYPILGCKFVSPTHQHEWNERIHSFFSLLEDVSRIQEPELNHLRASIEQGDLPATDSIRAACQRGIKTLLAKLQLAPEELNKMKFYLPPYENGEFHAVDANHGMTFFMGRRYAKRQVIYYQVNPLFLSGIDPKHAILIREPEFCESVENFHRSCKQGKILSKTSLSLAEFLDTLEEIDPALNRRASASGAGAARRL